MNTETAATFVVREAVPGSGGRPAPRPRTWRSRVALPAVALLVGALLAGCGAAPGAGEASDEATDGGALSATTELALQGAGHGSSTTTTSTGTTTTIPPASPDPQEPQPSPWRPTGSALAVPAQTTSPTTIPQPSPWQGYTPPPGVPNGQPASGQ